MKYRILTITLLFMFTASLFGPLGGVTPAQAQTCTDSTGSPIPCPTEEPQTDEDDTGSGGGGSNPTKPELLFLGSNENYLDPANWNNGGRIPGVDDSARLDGLTAVIDPRDPTPIPLGDMVLRNNAEIVIYDANVLFGTLDTDSCDRNATLLKSTARARKAYQNKAIIKANEAFHNSIIQTQTFLLSSGCGMNLDTSLLDARRIIVQNPDSFIQFSLGGEQPAAPEGRGPGHFAHIQGNSIDLDGQLDLYLVYGFRPQPGQTFQIITNTGSNTINGTFANMPEGAVFNGFCDIQFRITYAGGDGNDVVLAAETPTQPDPYCNEDFSNPRPDKNIFLDASSVDVQPDRPLDVNDIQLVNGAEWNLYDGRVTARIVDSTNSAINLFNSHLKTQTFIDPGGGFSGISLNPSFLEADRIVLYKPETPARFGLGGDQPASADGLGEGYHARMQAKQIDLDGQLDLFLVYGFRPQPGQTFQIITNTGGNTINGTFANAPEGSVLNGFCDIQFRITYTGGDGNDVVLTAETPSQPDPYSNEDFSNPRPDGNVLLDASSLDVEPDQPIEVNDIQLVNGAEVDFHDGFLQSEILDIKDSTFKLFNSHIKVNTFIYTGPSIKPDGPGSGGPWGNPSFLEAERIIISQSGGTIHLGLGGNQPAGENALGKGHYARMQGDNVQLDGLLDIFFVYDFVPQEGQTFEIISVLGSLKGAFVNAPEGSFVNGYCDIGLSISYQGGDGNDVVLTAKKTSNPNPEWKCTASAPAQENPASPVAEPEETPSTNSNLPYVVGGAVLVLIILLVVFLRKRSA